MTDTTEIPNDKLATLLIEQAKLDGEVDVHAPDAVECEPWEWLDTMEVTDIEADFENYDHVILHGEAETGYHKKLMSATHTDPAAYEYVPCVVNIGVWWDFKTAPEIMFEVHEE